MIREPTSGRPRYGGRIADSVALEPVDAIVVGGGLAGLAAAGTIHAAGRSVRLIEASDGLGGRVRTDLVDGFRLDRGFQVLLTAYPELERQLDVGALDLASFEPGADVWQDGRSSVVGDPFRRPGTLVPTVRSPVGSLADKARILRLRLRLQRADGAYLLRGDDITTLDALRGEGFSDRIIDRFFRPLFAGIQLDTELTTSRRMFDVIFRCLATGDAAVPASGMQAIPDQLARRVPDDSVLLGSPVVEVAAGRVRTADGRHHDATAVVVATEGPRAGELLGLPDVASRAVGCAYFAAPEAPTSSKRVQLGVHDGAPVNVAVMTNVAPGYGPTGRHLIVVALPGILEDIEARARSVVNDWWGAGVDHWTHLRSYAIAHGQPDQRPAFAPKQRVDLGEGLFVCGDHRDTASIQGALFSGRRCGEAVVAMLGSGSGAGR